MPIDTIEIEDNKNEEIGNVIDDYKLNDNWNFCGWYLANKFGLAHIDELFLVEYVENDEMYFVIQDSEDFDLCKPHCLDWLMLGSAHLCHLLLYKLLMWKFFSKYIDYLQTFIDKFICNML